MPLTRQYTASPRKIPNSSDTEQLETPPRKRFRENEDSSSCSSNSPRKRRRCSSTSPRKGSKDFNLENVLRRCAAESANYESILQLKDVPRDENTTRYMVQGVINSAKASVLQRFDPSKGKMLETELYLEWLLELDYLVSAVEAALNAKIPGTRRRVTGLGRVSYTLLFLLIDEFVSEVNSHHDSWSLPSSESDFQFPGSPTMTLVEESHDPTADTRSENAVLLAEECLGKIDNVMFDAVKRYKVECGRSNPSLASRIGTQEHTLAKSCCLLCEQTGYGGDGDGDDMGDTLMQATREAMSDWKQEYDDCEDQLIDSDADDIP